VILYFFPLAGKNKKSFRCSAKQQENHTENSNSFVFPQKIKRGNKKQFFLLFYEFYFLFACI
jgi:hypothetical protein